MPRMPKRPCPHPGCRALVEGKDSRCPEHLSAKRALDDRARGPARQWYSNRRWREIRRKFLIGHPFCAKCNRPAQVVDHITPRSEGGEEYEWDNLQALCYSCHNRKTRMEANARRDG